MSDIQERREALGISKRQLAHFAGIDRATLASLEAGKGVHQRTLAKVNHALEEMGAPPPAPKGELEYEVRYGDAVVVIRGPGAEDAVMRLLAELRR